ncbi:tryptophan synthase subunit beta [Streptococcus suis]|uniref:Tryptophan synthase subunit beta n=1 Tax=Streptococcus suis TaxID=1307 RepID=A0A116MZP3_STRSU|nr:tryptophan synthase subunit beta [Streptococcus suis]
MTEKGYFGQFGGSFVPEQIQVLLDQLEETFEQYRNDSEFLAEYQAYLKDYAMLVVKCHCILRNH